MKRSYFVVSAQVILAMFKGRSNLPIDAEAVVLIPPDPANREFIDLADSARIVFVSQEIPDVPEGEPIPRFDLYIGREQKEETTKA